AAQYRSTVLSAFQNVADALYALQSDAEALKAAVAAEQAAKTSLDLTLRAQQLGAVTFLAVLSAQQTYRQALPTRGQADAGPLGGGGGGGGRVGGGGGVVRGVGGGGGAGAGARAPPPARAAAVLAARGGAPQKTGAGHPGRKVPQDDQGGEGPGGGCSRRW